MAVILELYELKNLCMEMSELGAAQYQKRTAPARDELTQREAYTQFGEAKVKLYQESSVFCLPSSVFCLPSSVFCLLDFRTSVFRLLSS